MILFFLVWWGLGGLAYVVLSLFLAFLDRNKHEEVTKQLHPKSSCSFVRKTADMTVYRCDACGSYFTDYQGHCLAGE